MTDQSVMSGLVNEPLSQLSSATKRLFAYDATNQPTINHEAEAEAVGLGVAIGRQDGAHPGVDEHSARKILPSQDYVENSVEATMKLLGGDVDKAVKRSREGQNLSQRAPEPELSIGQKFFAWLKKHAFLGVAIISVAVLEYIIGISWTQRVFHISDDSAHVVALILPVLFAAIGVTGAHAIMISARPSAKKFIFMSFVLTVVGVIATIVCAGLVVSGRVEPGSSNTGGVTGGTAGAPLESGDDGTFTLVKFGVYVALLFTVTALVLLLHLIDLYRAWIADTKKAAEVARTAPSPEQIASGNIAYLEQFKDVYEAMREARQNVIRAYVSGVRSTLSNRISDDWDHSSLLGDPERPEWLSELDEEIERLERDSGLGRML
ncbi:hypothetical protein [Aeromicrobium duanguangcaii]|uniref:hypothetical protein n=1 Tax=Aeromicrobium duanguangcaii TaxID=2968086 RepID=UPI0020180277|nr:hypothetical protein [Aeromicrobium duanguangcaii]MCL3836886.1 hypothetical protein [Aeromicrobium duanguangcaii]